MTIAIAATEAARDAADQVQQLLEEEALAQVHRIVLSDRPSVESMFRAIDTVSSRLVHLISPDMLRSAEIMSALLEHMEDDQFEASYSNGVVPVLLSSEFVRGEPPWQRKSITDFWLQVHDRFGLKLGAAGPGQDVDSVIDLQETAEYISSLVGEYHDLIDSHRQAHRSLDEFLALSPAELRSLFRPIRVERNSIPAPLEQRRAELQSLHDSIVVPPPGVPEFPPSNPRFPATPHYELTVRGHRVLLKDEGQNPTGSHKDRLAWETIVFYKRLLRTRLLSNEIGRVQPVIATAAW